MVQPNVKENNINNKRLSRLQGVILKILSFAYPIGYEKRQLAWVVAEGYGNGSILTESPREVWLTEKMPDFMKQFHDILRLTPTMDRRSKWLNPKFSVAYSRSIRSLLDQGLVVYSPATSDMGNKLWAMFITEQGSALAKDRKVKINAEFWDAFTAIVPKQQEQEGGE